VLTGPDRHGFGPPRRHGLAVRQLLHPRGLRRYGFNDEGAQIAGGMLDAAALLDGRLPEAFGG
jgi:hypothetical protein